MVYDFDRGGYSEVSMRTLTVALIFLVPVSLYA